jgi:hypothetical protein
MFGTLDERYAQMTSPALPAGRRAAITNDTFIYEQPLLKRWGCGTSPTVQILPMPMQLVIDIVA